MTEGSVSNLYGVARSFSRIDDDRAGKGGTGSLHIGWGCHRETAWLVAQEILKLVCRRQNDRAVADDGYYRRKAIPHNSGGFFVWADSRARAIPLNYPSTWFCVHQHGCYHRTREEAINCPDYQKFLSRL